MNKIFVNGAAGHLGLHIVKELQSRGYNVRASVRNVRDTGKTRYLQKAGVEIVESSLTDKASLEAAIRGCSAVFHVAAPFKMSAKNMQKEIYEATIAGTRNILETVQKENISKIVYTSSVGCVGSTGSPKVFRHEDDWVQNPTLMYVKAKTDAEKLFHEFVETHKINGVAALPSTMIGPGFSTPNPSTALFVKLVQKQVPAVLPAHFDFVDVRDVARAHVDLFEKKNASGRYILAGGGYFLSEIFPIIKNLFPGMKVPVFELPQSLLSLAVFFDWLEDKMKGSGRLLTKDVLTEFGNKRQNFSTQKAQREIGWTTRSIEESLKDTIEWIQESYLPGIKSGKGPGAAVKKPKNAI